MSDHLPPVVNGHASGPRRADGRFAPGYSGGPGRPKGSRHKLSEVFLEQLVADFERHGPSAIESVRRTDPASYLRVIAALVPKEIGLSGTNGEAVCIQVVTGVCRSPGDAEELV